MKQEISIPQRKRIIEFRPSFKGANESRTEGTVLIPSTHNNIQIYSVERTANNVRMFTVVHSTK